MHVMQLKFTKTNQISNQGHAPIAPVMDPPLHFVPDLYVSVLAKKNQLFTASC